MTNETRDVSNRSLYNIMSMLWHHLSWSQYFCLLGLCLFGSGEDWCRYGCYCGKGSKVEIIHKNWEYKTCISKTPHSHLFCLIYGNLSYRVMYHRMNLMLFVRNMTSVGMQSLKTKSVHMDYGNITNGIWSMDRYYTCIAIYIK